MGPAADDTRSFRIGYVAIVGEPNVGKSTLMNGLLQRKLAIVTPKPQTTRHRILGILNGPDHQIIFLDTPGLIRPRYPLHETMVKTARTTMKEADLILYMVEAKGRHMDDDELTSLEAFQAPVILVINKVDLVQKDRILPIIDHYQKTGQYSDIVPISALKADGLDRLLGVVIDMLPQGDPFYPPDIVSDEPERFFVAEMIREQIFLYFGDEIPYATSVQVETFRERTDRKDYILATIYVEQESQKGIVIGKGGRALKKIGLKSREHIERFLDRAVYLELHVRVKRKWRRDADAVRRLGY